MPVWRNGRVPLANRLLDYLLPISFDLAEIALCPVDGSDVACVDAGRAKEAASKAFFPRAFFFFASSIRLSWTAALADRARSARASASRAASAKRTVSSLPRRSSERARTSASRASVSARRQVVVCSRAEAHAASASSRARLAAKIPRSRRSPAKSEMV